jgi:hypothetical protein
MRSCPALPQNENAIGREAFRPMNHFLDAGVSKAGTRTSASVMCCSKWSQSSSNNWNPSGSRLASRQWCPAHSRRTPGPHLFLEIGAPVRSRMVAASAARPATFSVITYWCFTGCKGTLTPAIAPPAAPIARRSSPPSRK